MSAVRSSLKQQISCAQRYVAPCRPPALAQTYLHAVESGIQLREAELAHIIRVCNAHKDATNLYRLMQDMKAYRPTVELVYYRYTLVKE